MITLPRAQDLGGASGFATILAAALIWGVGNAITGLSAHHYVGGHSVLPGLDIAVANTVGGIVFLTVCLATLQARARTSLVALPTVRTLLAGAMKGANTFLFVLAATHIAATEALVLESTYVVFSLALATVVARAQPNLRMWGEGALLLIGAALVQGLAGNGGGTANAAGVVFGLGAALTYALFLAAWAAVTAPLAELTGQVTATLVLLLMALTGLLLGGEMVQAAQGASFWVPLSELNTGDMRLQLANGVFVIGIVYLLITVGLQRLQDASRAANALASLALIFAIPFTLLTELIMGRITPSVTQLVGVGVFMLGFAILARDHTTGESRSVVTTVKRDCAQ